MTRNAFLGLVAFLLTGCASQRLSGMDLDEVRRPAFISRIELEAGPHSLVFREDSSYREKLKKLEPKEADRRLQTKLTSAVTRFEVSERLRVTTFRQLPREQPWLNTVDPARVASVLESFLVEEVPANAPDYDLLAPLGADAVVEFVIEDYGMRSKKGRAGAYIRGYARMFWLKSKNEIWRHPFRLDRVEEGADHLDPFKVGKDPSLFRLAMTEMLDELSTEFSQEMTPDNRKEAVPVVPDAGPESDAPGRERPLPQRPEPAPGELPDPDS
ncbi:hypothetical protein [Melittangium boletus]|uniref:Lipoprotein n=1 Tax=Melittangium boletus DSM 14713 TaxID=1294270 RepID=A0A250IRS7_9BACT|nr:hypothetical protein [Melittangium boletus]ATB33953.1 hypothetical protein MEBOL_007454 [Melittangium boletus DSM 14713]